MCLLLPILRYTQLFVIPCRCHDLHVFDNKILIQFDNAYSNLYLFQWREFLCWLRYISHQWAGTRWDTWCYWLPYIWSPFLKYFWMVLCSTWRRLFLWWSQSIVLFMAHDNLQKPCSVWYILMWAQLVVLHNFCQHCIQWCGNICGSTCYWCDSLTLGWTIVSYLVCNW